MAEIMSGRATVQQELATTCTDPATKGPPRRGEDGGLTHEPVGAVKKEISMKRPDLNPLTCVHPECPRDRRPGENHRAVRKVYGRDGIRL